MSSLRVSLDVSAVPPSPTGAGRYVVELARALSTRGDVDLVLVSRRDDGDRWRETARREQVVAAAPAGRPARLAWEQVRLPGLLGRLAPDVHHGPHYTVPARVRSPRVTTVHDLTFLDHPEWHEPAKRAFFTRALRHAARRADGIVCVSQFTADRLRATLEPRGAVRVIPHGVDHARWHPDDDGRDLERLTALGVHRPYIAFVGVLEPRKDVPTLVRAFDRVAPSRPELSLVIGGLPGWGRDAVDAAVAASPARQRIVRTGWVPEAAAPALLRQAAAVAYPSLEEGFGLPALEALACGAPLVTTRGTAMEEVTKDAALLIPPGDADALADALDQTLAGGAGIEARRERGLTIAAAYTWEESAAKHIELYRDVARRARQRGTRD